MELIIIIAISAIVFIAILGFFKKVKLEKNQDYFITSIAKELNIPKEEVLWVFIEMGNTCMILSQEKGNEELAKDIDNRGHLKEYKHWKEIAHIVHESFYTYLKNHPEKK
jgi:hypothetical protein